MMTLEEFMESEIGQDYLAYYGNWEDAYADYIGTQADYLEYLIVER